MQEKYLVIGRNRRKDTQKQVSDIKQRKVIGKKGLGKLSVFGICDIIEVVSVKALYGNLTDDNNTILNLGFIHLNLFTKI